MAKVRAYAAFTNVDPREPVIVLARTRSRARAIIIRSLLEVGYAESWRDALDCISYFRREPFWDDAQVTTHRGDGEGYVGATP